MAGDAASYDTFAEFFDALVRWDGFGERSINKKDYLEVQDTDCNWLYVGL